MTLYMVLLAAFQVLLSRLSGQLDIAVGSPVTGRTQQRTQKLGGPFVNTPVMRTRLTGDPSFTEVLRRVKETALGAYAHQDIPLEKLIMQLQPECDSSRAPLFQALFAFQNLPQQSLDLPQLKRQPHKGEHVTAQPDLSLQRIERSGAGAGSLRVRDGSVRSGDDRAVERTLLDAAGRDRVTATERVNELELLSEAERRQIVEGWKATTQDYPRERCLHELFSAQAASTPQAVAVVYETQQLTYAELESCSNQLANYLQGMGVGPEVVVGLCVERSLEMVVGLLGILKAGGAYLPLDPEYPAERLSFMQSDARAALILTTRNTPGGACPKFCV